MPTYDNFECPDECDHGFAGRENAPMVTELKYLADCVSIGQDGPDTIAKIISLIKDLQ